ncbi:MAG: lipopolysaccharide heptosyltransferase II [Candidatus Omnitrophota bacterium]
MVNKILFITLSNIGDVVLSLPALDNLRKKFPEAKVTVICSERAKGVFRGNPGIHRLIVYEKRSSLKSNVNLFIALWKENFDVVIDLRNSLFGAFLPAKYKTSPYAGIPKHIKHMKDRHLYKIQKITGGLNIEGSSGKSLYFSRIDEEAVSKLLKESGPDDNELIVISAGSRSHAKRWPKERFVELINKLQQEFPVRFVLTGDRNDEALNQYIAQNTQALNLGAKTSLNELGCLIKRARLLVANDSAVLHIASYFNIPVVAVFGITDDAKYGPWSQNSFVVKKEISCRPCQKAQCRRKALECIRLVKVEDVLRPVRQILINRQPPPAASRQPDDFKRILIARTDRIGDVLLSTPVIKALRDRYPQAYIAMMVSPYAKDIVEGNPYLDKVIILDKEGEGKNWLRSLKLIQELRRNKFDLALILHPSNRVHLLAFLSGIPRRIGYDRKLGFLLTDRIKHTKQLGEKHELEYNLDLLKGLGIEPKDNKLFMPVNPESEKWAEELFRKEAINDSDKLLAINPAASCPSKIWPAERFARVADRLAREYGFKILIIAGAKDHKLADDLMRHMRSSAINLAGKTSVTQLAGLLKRCRLFISNDSGPVHIASVVGTPVISIFGRNQAGLSPKRWGPQGARDKILHKASCIECLAHNCQREFACLKAISVEDVLAAADEILNQ